MPLQEKGFVKYHPLATCQGLLFLLVSGNPSFIRDKGLGPRKHRTHLVDEGADEVDEADLQLGELVRLVSVHHGLSWGRKRELCWPLRAARGQGPTGPEAFLPNQDQASNSSSFQI